MIQISIKKQGVVTNGPSPFETLELAEAHVAREEANRSYGELERVKPVIECSPEELAIALEIIPESIGEMGQVIPESARLPKMYEVIIEDVTVQVQAEAAKQAKIQAGIKAREACQLVLDYIAGCNLDKELSMEQITQMQQTLAQPEAALRAARPSLAKLAIAAITPDGILITEEEKQQALNLLADY